MTNITEILQAAIHPNCEELWMVLHLMVNSQIDNLVYNPLRDQLNKLNL